MSALVPALDEIRLQALLERFATEQSLGGLVERRADRHGVHGDTRRRELRCHAIREGVERQLADGVGPAGFPRSLGRDVDDAAPAAVAHDGSNRTAHDERSGQIDIDDGPPVVHLGAEHGRELEVTPQACIVHEDVDAPEIRA